MIIFDIIIPIIFVGVFITIFTMSIISAAKGKGIIDTDDLKSNIKNIKEKVFNNVEEVLGKDEANVTCEYCKSVYSKKEKKCPNCGAAKPRK